MCVWNLFTRKRGFERPPLRHNFPWEAHPPLEKGKWFYRPTRPGQPLAPRCCSHRSTWAVCPVLLFPTRRGSCFLGDYFLISIPEITEWFAKLRLTVSREPWFPIGARTNGGFNLPAHPDNQYAHRNFAAGNGRPTVFLCFPLEPKDPPNSSQIPKSRQSLSGVRLMCFPKGSKAARFPSLVTNRQPLTRHLKNSLHSGACSCAQNRLPWPVDSFWVMRVFLSNVPYAPQSWQ